MTSFRKQWDAMSIEERIDHLLADWKSCQETNDPVVLRVAATMAHHVLGQAREAMDQLRLSCEERGANWASHEHEMREQITALRNACAIDGRTDDRDTPSDKENQDEQ